MSLLLIAYLGALFLPVALFGRWFAQSWWTAGVYILWFVLVNICFLFTRKRS